jgi:hypothetical protein
VVHVFVVELAVLVAPLVHCHCSQSSIICVETIITKFL